MMTSMRVTCVLLLAAACGGGAARTTATSTAPTPPTTGGAADTTSTPFDADAVRSALAAAPGTEACSTEAGETFAALMTRQGALLGGPGQIEERFVCQPPSAEDGEGAPWLCVWSVMAKPPASVDPDDPCGGECCSSFAVQVEVTAAGAANLAGATCLAAG